MVQVMDDAIKQDPWPDRCFRLGGGRIGFLACDVRLSGQNLRTRCAVLPEWEVMTTWSIGGSDVKHQSKVQSGMPRVGHIPIKGCDYPFRMLCQSLGDLTFTLSLVSSCRARRRSQPRRSLWVNGC